MSEVGTVHHHHVRPGDPDSILFVVGMMLKTCMPPDAEDARRFWIQFICGIAGMACADLGPEAAIHEFKELAEKIIPEAILAEQKAAH